MKTQIFIRQHRKSIVSGLLVLMCLLTFICVAPVSTLAASLSTETEQETSGDTNTEGASAMDAPVREPTNTTDKNDNFQLNISSNAGSTSMSATLQILMMITILSIAPSIILMITSFTRIIVVLHFVRSAIGTNTTPPNQVLIGLALFLTFFIMNPIITQINEEAIKPLEAGEITQEEALEKGMEPLREFMYGQTQRKDVKLFLDIAGEEWTEDIDEIPNSVLIPSFIVSELRVAFIIGFIIYIPFIVIDMVIASALMSMGMMMLPPTTISLPFKILLFVLADGWNLVIGNLVKTFY